MPPASEPPAGISFGRFHILPDRREVLADGRPVKLGGRAFDVLMVLIEARGAVVSKDALLARVWPGRIIEENSLAAQIAALRAAFGAERALIRTVSGRGYQFTGEIRVVAASPGAVAAQPASVLPPSNVPEPVSELIGRDAEVEEMLRLAGVHRSVTLTGAGGIGKTTLALALARELRPHFADGMWLAELSAVADPGLVPATVAAAVGLELSGGEVSAQGVAQALAERRLLLVLDTCEHVIDAAAAMVEAILGAGSALHIIATSREPLRAGGEWVYPVQPLAVPAGDVAADDDPLRYGAVRLFIERARAAEPHFAPDRRLTTMIAAICRRLDGIPLAIELAAARAAALGIEVLAARLDDRFSLLTGGRRTALPRHQTLKATLDWSYALLSEPERVVLRRLAIFNGPFSLEAAAAVVSGDELSPLDVVERVVDHVARSLISTVADQSTARYRLLDTTQAYALGKLREAGEWESIARRHAEYFLELLATVDDVRQSRPADEHLRMFRGYADEIQAALEWAFSPAGDRGVGVAMTIAAIPLWFELFQIFVARTRLEQALRYAEPGSDQEMRLRIATGHTLWYIGPENAAIEPVFARALEIAERIGAMAVRTQALWGLWASCRCRGDYPAALEMARRYADVAESTGDVGAMHLADRILGLTHHFLGHQPIARELTERALRHAHDLDSSLGLGYQVETPVAMAAQLARILWLQGFPDQAMAAATDAITAASKSGHPFAMGYALAFGSVPIALWTGDIADAGRLIELLIAHTTGNQRTEQLVRCFAGVLRLRNGSESEALIASFMEPRVDLFPIHRIAELLSLGSIPVPFPSPEPADVLWNTPELLRVDAELLLWHNAPGADEAAEVRLQRALEIAREQAALSWELRSATSLARLWRDQGRSAEATALLQPVYDRFTEGFGTTDVKVAKALLDALAEPNALRTRIS